MVEQVLVNESKYEGKYVALVSFSNKTVVAFGDDAENVLEEARAAGQDHPVIVFIPERNVDYILHEGA